MVRDPVHIAQTWNAFTTTTWPTTLSSRLFKLVLLVLRLNRVPSVWPSKARSSATLEEFITSGNWRGKHNSLSRGAGADQTSGRRDGQAQSSAWGPADPFGPRLRAVSAAGCAV